MTGKIFRAILLVGLAALAMGALAARQGDALLPAGAVLVALAARCLSVGITRPIRELDPARPDRGAVRLTI